MIEQKSVEEVLEHLRRLNATGEIDVIAVVALGKDPDQNLLLAGMDIDRRGDAVRLAGTMAMFQRRITDIGVEPLKEPGPQGIV